MHTSHITGTGLAVPKRVVTNQDLEKIMETSDEWIRQRTGIEQRHWVDKGETGAQLAAQAAKKALSAANLEASDLDAIVFATSSPDHFAPGTGVFMQRELGVAPIPALDVRAQCSGFIYALSVADAWIKTGLYQRVLVVGCEVQSPCLKKTTEGRDTAVIFADGAGAAILEKSSDSDRGLMAFDLKSDGKFAEELWVDAPGSAYQPSISKELIDQGKVYLTMNGREVFKHAVGSMKESTCAALEKLKLTPADISMLIPHQANLRISEMLKKALELSDDQVFNNIMKYGNTTAATIPIALDECVRAGQLKPGDIVVMTAFGSGFMWGSVVIRW